MKENNNNNEALQILNPEDHNKFDQLFANRMFNMCSLQQTPIFKKMAFLPILLNRKQKRCVFGSKIPKYIFLVFCSIKLAKIPFFENGCLLQIQNVKCRYQWEMVICNKHNWWFSFRYFLFETFCLKNTFDSELLMTS